MRKSFVTTSDLQVIYLFYIIIENTGPSSEIAINFMSCKSEFVDWNMEIIIIWTKFEDPVVNYREDLNVPTGNSAGLIDILMDKLKNHAQTHNTYVT